VTAKKRVLIITDGAESTQLIAKSIENALIDSIVKICKIQEFTGTDILPADMFFLGSESPSPVSFAYLEDMLAHINLVSRTCGIFSTNKEALKYLRKIVKDCEASLGEPFLAPDGKVNAPDVEKWVKTLLK